MFLCFFLFCEFGRGRFAVVGGGRIRVEPDELVLVLIPFLELGLSRVGKQGVSMLDLVSLSSSSGTSLAGGSIGLGFGCFQKQFAVLEIHGHGRGLEEVRTESGHGESGLLFQLGS
jgi:hypothetical protein